MYLPIDGDPLVTWHIPEACFVNMEPSSGNRGESGGHYKKKTSYEFLCCCIIGPLYGKSICQGTSPNKAQ